MKKDFYTNILVLQVVFATILVVTATVIRFVGGALYNDLKAQYNKYFLEETKIDDFFSKDKLTDFIENDYKVNIDEN